MILNDNEISNYCLKYPAMYKYMGPLIKPFVPNKIQSEYSYGLEPSSYTMRVEGESFTLEPGKTKVVWTLERLTMPRTLVGHLYLKTSYQRQGVIAQMGLVDPGYIGNLSVTILNASEASIEIIGGQGMVVIEFQEVMPPSTSYTGKYQQGG